MPKLKFVESTVFEIIGEGLRGSANPPFVEGVGTNTSVQEGLNNGH